MADKEREERKQRNRERWDGRHQDMLDVWQSKTPKAGKKNLYAAGEEENEVDQ